jgi:hypothetical protein
MMKLSVFLVALLLCVAPGAQARLIHGGKASVTPPAAPVLTDTTVTFGANTPNGRGAGVRLSSMDQTIPSYQPTTVYGLDLMSASGPACDTWTMFSFASNTSGRPGTDFNIISANTPEGSGAQAPNTSGTGATHLAGDYVWNVQCSAAGVLSNIAHLTYHTVTNMVTVGPADRFDFGWAASGFGSTPGAKICLATGGDFHSTKNSLRGVSLGSTLANPVTITVCDSPRYPYTSNFTTNGLSNFLNTDMVATGNTDIGIQATTSIFGSTNTSHTGGEWSNLRYYGSPLMYPSSSNNSGQGFFGHACTSSCYAHDLVADFVNSGFNIQDNTHYSNIDIGHFANNCTGIGSGSGGALVDNFTTCHDPLVSFAGQHTDCMQILDGATAVGPAIHNFWCIQAGGPGQPQGPWFGGGQFGETTHVWQGYIDDGTVSHGPGTLLHVTSGGGCFSSSNFSQIWVPAGGISISDNVRILCGAGQTTNISTLNLAATNIGSPASPATFSNVGARDFDLDGIVNANATFNGFASNGESGTSSLRHFSFIQQVPNPLPTTSFTGTVNGVVGSHASGTTITVAGAGTSSYPNILEPFINGAINYTGCTTCSTTGQSSGSGICCELSSTEPAQATANATFSGKTMTVSAPCTGRFDYNIANGSKMGGLLISGTGIPEGTYIIPQLFLPSDGCAGNYTLNQTVGTLGTTAVTGRPQMGAGLYSVYSTAAVPGGPYSMTALPFTVVSLGSGGYISQTQSGGSPFCVTNLHQGTFTIDSGYAAFISTCGPPVSNTTVTNTANPVGADFNTGVIPYTTVNAITAATWNAMTTAQKRAAYCNAMLPALGGALDMGGGVFKGSFTHTGEIQTVGGNFNVIGCGIH